MKISRITKKVRHTRYIEELDHRQGFHGIDIFALSRRRFWNPGLFTRKPDSTYFWDSPCKGYIGLIMELKVKLIQVWH